MASLLHLRDESQAPDQGIAKQPKARAAPLREAKAQQGGGQMGHDGETVTLSAPQYASCGWLSWYLRRLSAMWLD